MAKATCSWFTHARATQARLDATRREVDAERGTGARLVAMSRDPNVSRRRAYSGLAMTCDDSQL